MNKIEPKLKKIDGKYHIDISSLLRAGNLMGNYKVSTVDGIVQFFPQKFNDQTVDAILRDIKRELTRASSVFPAFKSGHEGWAVIKEEHDELWDEIKKKTSDPIVLREEAIQVGAMAVRFVHDLLKEFSVE